MRYFVYVGELQDNKNINVLFAISIDIRGQE
jgi:hypothetical protein